MCLNQTQFSQFIPSISPSSLVFIHFFSISLFLFCKSGHLYYFSRFHIYKLIYLFFSFLVISLYMTCSRSIHISTNDPISFLLWQSSIPHVCVCVCVYMYIHTHTHHIIFIHSSVDGHLGCFHVLAVLNSAAVNIGMHVCFQIMVSSSYVLRSGIAGSYVISIFSFLRNLNTLLRSGYTSSIRGHHPSFK